MAAGRWQRGDAEWPGAARPHGRTGSPAGFSLVELLAVVAILGTLLSLTLPGLQSVREAARRATCSNNLRQMGIALGQYESSRRCFPPGDDSLSGRNHAWSSYILPFLDEAKTGARIDYARPWNDPGGNAAIADAILSTYVCPGGVETFAGKQDYGGVLGTSVRLAEGEPLRRGWAHSGILYATSRDAPRPCRSGEVRDGLAHTLMVSEGVDRGFRDMDTESRIGNSRWACGTNCFLHNSLVLNTPDVDGFRSNHLGGVHGLFGDGHVTFMSDATMPDVLRAICTKAWGEEPVETP